MEKQKTKIRKICIEEYDSCVKGCQRSREVSKLRDAIGFEGCKTMICYGAVEDELEKYSSVMVGVVA